MNGDNSRSTWLSLVAAKRAELGSSEAASTCNEDEFRSQYEQTCSKFRETDGSRLYGMLSRQQRYVLDFTKGIDASNVCGNESLTGTLWAATLLLIQSASTRNVKLRDLLNLIKPLNAAFPNLGLEISRFPTYPAVQKSLQRIFSAFVDCYLKMINYFDNEEWEPFSGIAEDISNVEQEIQQAHKDWETEKIIAQNNEDRRFRERRRSPTYMNGSYSAGTTHISEVVYHHVRRLGNGGFGEVAEVEEATTRKTYACKQIHCRHATEAEAIELDVKNEVEVMHKLRHHHIAAVHAYVRDEDVFSIFMLPVADYDLAHYLEIKCPESNFARSEIKHLDAWFGCLISALAYAHSLDIRHKDIKTRNILIKDDQPFLADFGNAHDFSSSGHSATEDFLIKGTPNYLAPEERPGGQRGRATDIFALGCVFSEMLTVRQGQTLEAYRDARHNPDAVYRYAFRENLPKVREWLENLPDLGHTGTVLLEQTLVMIRDDKTERPDAPKVKRYFRGEELMCRTCLT